MCRLLYASAASPFDPRELLRPFAALSRASKEFQGHGWGCASWRDGAWSTHHDVRPIWECALPEFAPTTRFLAHARSAFEDRDVRVENNMPFVEHGWAFAFNGELRGVKLREEGRIGAEKLFRFVQRFVASHGMEAALRKALPILEQRSARVRAINLLLAGPDGAFAASLHREDHDYFTLHRKRANGTLMLCSEPFPGESGWQPLPNDCVEVLA